MPNISVLGIILEEELVMLVALVGVPVIAAVAVISVAVVVELPPGLLG